MICFLDRDGIINVDYGYVGTIERFQWNQEIFDILLFLQALGYRFVLVTNQSGIGRGFYSLSDFYDLSFYMLNYLSTNYSIELEINFCPHRPSVGCNCRKPSPKMMMRYSISPYDIMIGDNDTDMSAALSAGIQNRWLVSNKPVGPYTHSFVNLASLSRSLCQGLVL